MSPKYLDSILTLVMLGSLGIPLSVRAEPTSQLIVEIEGLKNRQGQICLSIFANSKGFPSNGTDAIQKKCVTITGTPQLVTFENLQSGSYAVAVLHDANNDSEANKNALGIPSEGFGFSGNPVIIAGPPKFGEAVVLVMGSSTSIQIKLNYF